MKELKTILVTGGAGYVGSALVPKLLEKGLAVRVMDLFWFGDHVLDKVKNNPKLTLLKEDIRDRRAVAKAVEGVDAVIHLACISNDPSFELDPALGKSINLDAFQPLVETARDAGVRRFVYASSSSVYGVKATSDVTENLPLEPLTDYSKFKAQCEEILEKERRPGFAVLTLRPATVCGWSPRLRLDLTVNILTNHAVTNRKILVFGGAQMRPNIHIDDMTDLYVQSLEWPEDKIDGKVFNAGYDNRTVRDIAAAVHRVVGGDIEIEVRPTTDNRSYHVNSDKIRRELGYVARRTVEDAVRELTNAFRDGKVPHSMTDPRYVNIKTMQNLKQGLR